jgi:SAM-dependent methyltransferase
MGLGRFLKNLPRRGIVRSADRMLSVLQERLFDLRYGTDTVAFADLKSLTIEGQHAAEGTGYQPTRLRIARKVISALDPTSGGGFVDFGCGKGRVLLLAADYGFRQITGVEFAKELCDIARNNIDCYRRKTGIQTDIRIVEGDAMEYEIQDDENVFFMSNPFSAPLVEEVARNIMRSLTARGRQGFIIYNNPVWSEAIEQQGFSPLLNFDARECIVYGNTLGSQKSRVERRRMAA